MLTSMFISIFRQNFSKKKCDVIIRPTFQQDPTLAQCSHRRSKRGPEDKRGSRPRSWPFGCGRSTLRWEPPSSRGRCKPENIFFDNYTEDLKSDHSKSGNIQNPDFLKADFKWSCFQMGVKLRSVCSTRTTPPLSQLNLKMKISPH